MLKPDMKYNGTVREGSSIIETMKGTLGYQVNLECDDGNTSYTIWLTEKNRDNAVKAFGVLGVPAAHLGDHNFLEHELSNAIVGTEVCFGTAEEEYKGKRRIKVAWIGKKRDSLGAPLSEVAAGFFSGKPAPGGGGSTANGDDLEDDMIPF